MNPWEKYQKQEGPWTRYQQKPVVQDAPYPSAIDEMGNFDRFLAGMGNALNAPYRGVRQALGLVSQKEIDEEARLGKPLLETGAGAAGDFAGTVLPALAVPVASIPAAMGLGAAQAAAQPVKTGESRMTNTAIGGAAGGVGQAVAKGVGALMRGPANVLSPAERGLAEEAKRFGIELTPAQQTGNKFLRTVDSVLDQMPATAGASAQRKSAQAAQFTKALTGQMGSSADDLSEGAMAANKARLGDIYREVFDGEKIAAEMFAPRLGLVKAEAMRALPADKAKVVANKIDDLFAKVEDGTIDGLQYQKWRSSLKSTDGDTKHYLKLAKNAVDDQAGAALSPGKMEKFLQANVDYRNMKTLQPLAEKSVSGMASPALLLEQVRKSSPNMAYGEGGDMAKLAKIGKAFVQETTPNSGTAQRMMAQTLLTGGVGGGTLAMTGDPEQALKAGLGTMASTVLAPKMAQSLLNTPAMQRYLLQGAPIDPAVQELLKRGLLGSSIGLIGP